MSKSTSTALVTTTSPDTKLITLDTPIQRGEQTITAVTLRKPKSGSLRGLNLASLLQMETNAIFKVVPRISEPALTEPDMAALDPADLLQLGSAVGDFLLTKAVRAEVSPSA
ncbi:phage tail assembly protein [Chitinimonas sp. BJB300]|uniref:phage tail assembly protein n=1 Tax=Chitinimonas sp. BJB300 TaxID=1559339 RepID=UPI000C0E12FA|nr:phage tail assembly protein [Chitinimonas sp. BJB300]PHV11309.1 phage tail protein [Chitinimonas sp. BJB300]TSJ88202.1 phage tail assembly protein [Chitinimonas sp. BJB300]